MDGSDRAHLPTRAFARLERAIRAVTGRSATDRQRQQFQLYLELVVRWNRVQRLTGPTSPGDIVEGLFEDSLLFLPRIPGGQQAVVDIGAGAGIPGVPLAIVRPEISMVLIESKRKRASFLHTVKRQLQAQNLMVIEGRAEHLVDEPLDLEGVFDVVVSRAVGNLDELLPTAMRYLKSGGLFVVSGPPIKGGEATDKAGSGMTPDTVTVPELGLTRMFLTAKKKSLDQAAT